MNYPTFSFGRICGPKFQNLCLFVTGYLQIGTHLNIHSFQLEVLGFQTFQSELSVVWAKRSLVAKKIESKSYISPLKYARSDSYKIYVFEYTKQAFRWDGSFEYPQNIAY